MARDVVVIIGAGGIGMAIARRQGIGKTVLLADWNEELLAKAVAELETASYAVATQRVDVSSRASVADLADAAAKLGPVTQVVNTAGLSPNMAPWRRCWRSIFMARLWCSRNLAA
jgi:NADP-dependent 3-hydroxy acid dehydrogenase YdfG